MSISKYKIDKLDVNIANINLGTLIQMVQGNEISLELGSQQLNDTWNNTKKSQIIEYILLGLPIPSFYLSEEEYSNKLIVIEGLKCLYALWDFAIKKTLKLQDLQFLPHLEGKGFNELQPFEIRKIKSLRVTVNILKKSTPEDLRLIILNTYHNWNRE